MAINFPTNPQLNDVYTSGNTTWQYDGSVWNVVSSSAQVSVPNAFNTIAVTGQDSVVADTTNDTLNLIGGSNITITTSAASDSITINSAGGGEGVEQNLWATVAGDNGATTANTATDTLTVAGGSSITTSVSGDTLTINYSGASPTTTFSNLTDSTSASLTVDKIYLPAITMLEVTNVGASAYRFDQYGTTDNPTIYVINGTTIAFHLDITGHPFLIQDSTGTNYNTGLTHVTTNGTISTGAAAQGQTSGTLYWKIPNAISSPPNYRYQCSVHGVMVGAITIKNFGSI